MASTTVKKHAVFSPSSVEANMLCVGKIAMEHGLPDTSSRYADEGTCAHFLGAYCLEHNENADDYTGDVICLWRDPLTKDEGEGFLVDMPKLAYEYHREVVDLAFAQPVQTYVQIVRDYAQGQKIHVEQKLGIEAITGEEDASGTSDAVVVLNDELVVIDLKFGQGVEVSAEDNGQLKVYALAAYLGLSPEDQAKVKQARLVISQPRITAAPSEWVIGIEDLQAFGRQVQKAAKTAFIALEFRDNWVGKPDSSQYLVPGEKQCKWCKAAANNKCLALDDFVVETAGLGFEDLTQESVEEHSRQVHDIAELGKKMRAVPLLETWIAGVRAASERELMDSRNSPDVIEALGFKIVQGKRENRAWIPTQQEKLERLLKRLLGAANCYTKKLLSPSEAEKALKGEEKEWKAVLKYITQSEGKPSVAPITDKREPLVFEDPADEFEDLTATDDDLI